MTNLQNDRYTDIHKPLTCFVFGPCTQIFRANIAKRIQPPAKREAIENPSSLHTHARKYAHKALAGFYDHSQKPVRFCFARLPRIPHQLNEHPIRQHSNSGHYVYARRPTVHTLSLANYVETHENRIFVSQTFSLRSLESQTAPEFLAL